MAMRRTRKNTPDQQEQAPNDTPITPSEVLPARLAPDGQTYLDVPVHGPEPNEDGEQELEGGERVRRAVMLRLSGASFDQIAHTLGYANAKQARSAVNRSVQSVQMEAQRELKRVQHMRLEHMLMLLWPSVNAGDLPSMAAACQIMDRIERLHGLAFVPPEVQTEKLDDSVLIVGGNKADYLAALEQAKRKRRGV
jgi:hypothetical protein